MPCMKIESGYICYGEAYKYKGYYFELHKYHGPCPLKKNSDPSRRTPKGFWDMITEFMNLSDSEKIFYKVW
jgi:hypothetical protein